jgi:lipopolysaccharide transport system ATP-binding protein
MPDAIAISGLGKRFRRYDPDRAWTFQEALMARLRGHRPAQYFWGLRDITLSVPRGRAVGLIGRNGAGKSTLLRLMGGIGRPDEGSIQVQGRISGLLDLGVGFHSDLTGKENIFISGVIGGLTRREIAERYDSIVEFAELREFIDSPLRTYSSGMHMRLAFSVAIHTEPDILLIDEVLAVGDIGFQRKCLDRIAEFKERGCTIAMVSHDPGLIQGLCDDAVWLDEGRIREVGPAARVVGQYVHEMETLRRTPVTHPPVLASTGIELRVHENRFGSFELELERVQLLDSYEKPTAELMDDGPLMVELEYCSRDGIRDPIFAVTILDAEERVCYDTNSQGAFQAVPESNGRGVVEVSIAGLDLDNGKYYVDVGAYEREWAYTYDYHWKAYPIVINRAPSNGPRSHGSSSPRAEWRLR